jgi:hypothetical protein
MAGVTPKKMLEEPASQVGHHAVAEDGREIGLEDADQGGRQRDHDHQPDEERQQPQSRAAADEERVVEEPLRQERGDDAETAGDDDRDRDEHQPRAIGPEELRDPPQESRVAGRRSAAPDDPPPSVGRLAPALHGHGCDGSGAGRGAGRRRPHGPP